MNAHPSLSSSFAELWSIDPSILFLNHGSYGAVPRDVQAAHAAWRSRVEREAVRFYKVDLEQCMDEFRRAVGAFIGCPAECLAPVPNATVAIATILANTPLGPGDEIVITDHEYQSGINELQRVCERTGARVVTAAVPFPIAGPEAAAEAVLRAIGPRTKLVMVSQITSATSLILPVAPVVAECRRRGIDVVVDGAHGPGQIPVDVASLDPTYYIGSGHKWVSGPKGTGFLYVHPDKTRGFRPIWLSGRAHKIRPERALFLRDFDYSGTSDYTGILSIPSAIRSLGSMLPGGWDALYAQNHDLVMRGRRVVLDALGIGEPAPESMIGSMATIPLPEPSAAMANRATLYDDPLQDALLERHRIVTPVWRLNANNVRVVRISAHLYNTIEQYEVFARALVEELEREGAEPRPGRTALLEPKRGVKVA
jgi:isopenicillin-N epimerase